MSASDGTPPGGDGHDDADRDEMDLLAAEYVAGLLDGAQMRLAERQVETDPAFAERVWAWRRRLAPLDEAAPPVSPAAGTWARIEDALNRAQPAPVFPAAAPAPRRPRIAAGRGWLGRRLADGRTWQATTVLAAAAALLLAVFPPRGARELRPVAAAVLQAADQTPVYLVEVYADRSMRVKPLGQVPTPGENRSLQFWTLRDRQEGPLSLGLLPVSGLDRVGLGQLPLPLPGQLFEITVEPPGGSPTGRPTGAILGKGLAAQL